MLVHGIYTVLFLSGLVAIGMGLGRILLTPKPIKLAEALVKAFQDVEKRKSRESVHPEWKTGIAMGIESDKKKSKSKKKSRRKKKSKNV